MNENIIKAYQCAQLLDGDLRQIYKRAITDKNEALLILMEQLIEANSKTLGILNRLEDFILKR
jgi:hypothetical protein